MNKTEKTNVLYQMLNCYLNETILDSKEVEEAEKLAEELEEAINYTHSCESDSEQLPSFLYKSDGGLYFKHRENTDVTQQWNEYLKTR